MCGRYYVNEETAREMETIVRETGERLSCERTGDILPSQSAFVLTGRRPELGREQMRWGFPQRQKKGLLINARAETVLERKTFRESVLHRRCIIPAARFYEWDGEKNKAEFWRQDGPVLYMAGFYDRFPDGDHFIIITTRANASVAPVHDRMPLILEKNELESWVYDDQFLPFALKKEPVQLERYRGYEQQSFVW